MDRAVGKDGLDTGDQRAHRAELEHLSARRVGARSAAMVQLPRAPGQRETAARCRGAIVQILEIIPA
jgi:hypothetical protein